MPDNVRRECVWCDSHHEMDGGGPITQEDRDAGRVVTGLCPEAKDRVATELDAIPQLSEEQERLALLRYADAPLPEELDEAGIVRSVIPSEKVLVWVIVATIAVVALGFLLGRI